LLPFKERYLPLDDEDLLCSDDDEGRSLPPPPPPRNDLGWRMPFPSFSAATVVNEEENLDDSTK
jgi:hypothetical protein